MSEPPAIDVRDLSKTYEVPVREGGLAAALKSLVHRHTRQVEAVKEINFEVAPGEIVGFLGPNGAGKTTTLKMLSGLLYPSGGQCRVLGIEPFKRQRDYLRQITLVMGNRNQLIWDIPVLDSFERNRAIYRIERTAYQRTVDELTELLDLAPFLDKPVRNHTLMQTISRANRVFAEKHSGLIVDYVGVFRRLEQALAIYGAPSGGSADDLVLPKEKLVEALTESEADLRASLDAYGADLDGLIAAEGFDYAKRLADTAELVLAAGEEERRSFVNRTNRFMRIYRAALPNPDAFALSRIASALRMIVKRVQLATPAADISAVMERINDLLDESIAAEGFLIPDLPDEERIVDLSGVDWDALQEATTRRYTAAERIKQLLAERTSRIARTNPTYEDLAEKFENLVEAYNNGSINIEELLRRLRALVGELDEYEQRLVTEDLTEEQLAVFDLLTKPEPELTDEEQAQVKGLARELFAHIEETLVLDWRKNQEGRGRVRVALETHLDQLPGVYDPDLFETKCGLVYEYVFSRADDLGS